MKNLSFDLLDASMSFCFKHLNLSGKVVGLRRIDKLGILVEALREAFINAYCHRSYDDQHAAVSLAIYDDRVEIINPGHLPSQLSLDTIKKSHRSFPHNLIIANVLYKTGYLENWETGVERMEDACLAANIPEPEYMATDYEVGITFKRTPYNITGENNVLSGQTGAQIMSDAILALIATDSHITRKKLSEMLGINPSAIQRHINKLKEDGKIVRKGGDFGGRWIVNKK